MGVLPARKGGREAAPGAAAGGPSWGPRLALALFLVLFAFGLVLLFVPDLATELDERTGGGEETAAATVTVTEAKRTTESDTRARSTSEKRSQRGGADGPRSSRPEQSKARGTRRQSSRATTETTTTTTSRGAPDPGAFERTLGVPAVVVVTRTALVALLAALVAWALLRLTRAAGSRDPAPAPEAEPANPGPRPAAPAQSLSDTAGDVQPARSSPITPDDAEAARASVVEGIPLLREVFAARGEPAVDQVLPDMRVAVQLTETVSKEQALPVSLFAFDPALGMAAFRTELEQRLRRLARDADLQCTPSIDAILHNLTEEGLFEPGAADGFRTLLRLAQRALHGGEVDAALTGWVTERGVPLLLSLDLMLPS